MNYGSDGESTGNGWEIANTDPTPLVIYDVTLNGEYSAPLAFAPTPLSIEADRNRTMPVTLTIGESAAFLKSTLADGNPEYWKDVVFVEVNTDRGKFKFNEMGMQIAK